MAGLEDIAVIGVGCRFPGAASLTEFWDVLKKGENHIRVVPPDRWNAETFYDPTGEADGKSYSNKGGFIDNYAHFDHKLFGISETEAAQMDPQQRHVLECTCMALENAGITRQHISGQKVGVYIGAMNSDFTVRMTANYDKIDNYSVAGLAGSVIANRVSYVFNVSGPSMVIDTACSSSLVAVHQACLGIRAGDCQMAICGGVNLMMHPTVFLPLSKARMLSTKGQCSTFSAEADGYTRGEGCGIVLLKPLSQAISDGDNIWGVIMTGVNQDGRAAQPITAPSGNQQLKLLRDVYSTYSVNPQDVDYIEAHGTGTRLGDPIEMKAFGKFFGSGDSSSSPSDIKVHDNDTLPPRCRYIGSVKTNIGHLEPAAGVAGLIKVLLMMKYDTIVPSLHFDKPNDLIDFDKHRFTVPTKSITWASSHKVACINSFGFGGTNSHAIIKGFSQCQRSGESAASHQVVCFSGSEEESLRRSINDTLSCDLSHVSMRSLAYTSSVRRESFPQRKAFVVQGCGDLRKQIEHYLNSKPNAVPKTTGTNVVFVFCGMGTAYTGMCRELMVRSQVFASAMIDIEAILRQYVPWSLTRRLEEGFNVEDPMFGPIAIFSCQVALTNLWEALGMHPSVVVGQSVGEVAAAHCAGILTLEEAVKVIYNRSNILSGATEGKMCLIRNANIKRIEDICSETDNVEIALIYSPVTCTISGESTAVDNVISKLKLADENDQPLVTPLKVTSAFHSSCMDKCQQLLDEKLGDLVTISPTVPMISTVDTDMTDKDLMYPSYWGQNVRRQVRFCDAIQKSAVKDSRNLFIEIGPTPVLKAHLCDMFADSMCDVVALPSLTRKEGEISFLKSLSFLYEQKFKIKWETLFQTPEPPLPFPRYAFSHKQLMMLPVITEEEVFGTRGNTNEHLFVKKSSSTFEINISNLTFATVYEHKVRDIIVVPGATYAEAGFGLAKVMKFGDPGQLSVSVSFQNPVTLKNKTASNLDADIEQSDSEFSFIVKQGTICHASGRVTQAESKPVAKRLDLQMIQERCCDKMDRESVYKSLQYSGFTYGSSFATIDFVLKGKSENLAKLSVGTKIREEMEHTIIHPAILDGMLQSAAATDIQDREFLPVELKNVVVHQELESEMFVLSRMVNSTGTHTSFTMVLLSVDGTVLAEIEKFSVKFIGAETFDEQSATFKTDLVRLDDVELSFVDSSDDDNVVIFTDTEMVNPKTTWVIHELDFMAAEGTKNQLDEVIDNIDLICFVFPLGEIKSNGEDVQDELMRRIMSLRLILLYLANVSEPVPLVIISEVDETSVRCGEDIATCLQEAMKGFVRCALREYRSLKIQVVDVEWDGGILHNFDDILSILKRESVKNYPEVQIVNGNVHVHTIVSHSKAAPDYRLVKSDGKTNAVLCSGSKETLTDLAFFPQLKDGAADDMVEVEVTSVTFHPPTLTAVTINEQITESKSGPFPVLSLEAIGKHATKTGSQVECVTCYPVMVCNKITLPKGCIVGKERIPGYFPGYLTKFYLLWRMCKFAKKNICGVIYSKSTLGLARALSRLLMSLGARSVTIATLEELDAGALCLCTNILPTVQLSPEVARNIVKHSDKLTTMTCWKQITNDDSLSMIAWAKPTVRILELRKEDFSQHTMQEEVPKMLKWIQSHGKVIGEIALHFKQNDTPINPPLLPIDLSEIVMTNTISISAKDHLHSTNFLNTETRQLNSIDQSGCSYEKKHENEEICESLETSKCDLVGSHNKFNHNQRRKSASASINSIGELDIGYMKTPESNLFQKHGTYLVVGGLTGLGWECVLYLARRGAGSIVTMSRSKPSEERRIEMDIVAQKNGCLIRSMQADVTVFTDVENILAQIQKLLPEKPLKGVFYGAAVLVDATLLEMTDEKLRKSLSPKVIGIWNLHSLTRDLSLDFFVMHSSGAAVLGNAGQSNYGAGNAFMDGLAHGRRRLGLPGQSINWGPLDLGLLDNKAAVMKRLQSQGYMAIEKENIDRCLTHMLMLNEPQALMCRIDKQKMADQLTKDKEKTLLTRLEGYLEPALKNIRNKGTCKDGNRGVISVEKLKSLSREEALRKVLDYVKYLACDKALLDEDSFEVDSNMKDQGVDSMYAMEITGQILTDTGVKMSAHEIQLQSANIVAKSILQSILNEGSKEVEERNTVDETISTDVIMSSIANSICGFFYNCDFNMGFVIVSTIQLPDIVDVATVREIARECVSRHSITTCTWTMNSTSVTSQHLPVDKALDFRVITGNNAKEVKSHTEEPINIDIQVPIRFILLVKRLQLRIVFHKFAFDLKAITTFVKEFESLAGVKQQGRPFKDVHTEPDKDIADEIKRVLTPNLKTLTEFWRMKVMYMTYNTLSRQNPLDISVNSQTSELNDLLITKTLDKKLYSQIMFYAKQQGLTPFDLLVSIYQFLLAVVSNKPSSTVTISVDLRTHVPALTNSLGRCTNFIPLICQLPANSASSMEFLQRNKQDIERHTRHGLLPSDEIKRHVRDTSASSMETNFFIYEDDFLTTTHNNLQVDMPVTFSKVTETFFYIWQRRATKSFEAKLHLRKDLFSKTRGKAIVEAFVGLLTDLVTQPELTLGQLSRRGYMLALTEDEARHTAHNVSSTCSIL